MIYSCFDAERGDYRLFEDDSARAVNADLDVPQFSRPTKLGAPSIESGRTLPAGAKPAGRSWSARGMVVTCGAKRGLSGELPSPSGTELTVLFVGASLGALLLAFVREKR